MVTPKSSHGNQMRSALFRTLSVPDEQSPNPPSFELFTSPQSHSTQCDVSQNDGMKTLVSSSTVDALPSSSLHADPVHNEDKIQLSQLQREIASLREELIAANVSVSEKANEILGLHRQLKDTDSRYKRQSSSLTTKMDNLQKTLNAARDEITRITAEKREGEKKHASECAKMSEQLRQVQAKLDTEDQLDT
jgi:septal ring factor EnvC (AmiA/AmiB activator)